MKLIVEWNCLSSNMEVAFYSLKGKRDNPELFSSKSEEYSMGSRLELVDCKSVTQKEKKT